MLHRRGPMNERALADALRDKIDLYRREDQEEVYINFIDDDLGRERWVKFQLLADQWVFVDITDKPSHPGSSDNPRQP